MRIKKTFQTTVSTGKVLNNRTESNVDTYSCNYINGLETYSTDETKTNKVWIDGKPIYRKIISFTTTSGSSSKTLSDYIPNYNKIISIEGFTTSSASAITPLSYYVSASDYSNYYIDSSQGKIWFRCGTNYGFGAVEMIIEYTKTTD